MKDMTQLQIKELFELYEPFLFNDETNSEYYNQYGEPKKLTDSATEEAKLALIEMQKRLKEEEFSGAVVD